MATQEELIALLKETLEKMEEHSNDNDGEDPFRLNCPGCVLPRASHSLPCRIRRAVKTAGVEVEVLVEGPSLPFVVEA